MKGLILCAGKGRRLQPLSFSQTKVMLPVANRPVLYNCIDQLLELGIREIGIVVNRAHKRELVERLDDSEHVGVTFTFIEQTEPRGIADAVKQAEAFIDRDPFLLLLGDNLIQESLLALKESLTATKNNAAILLAKVRSPQDYGIAEIVGQKIVRLEEKPRHPKSDLAVIGAYAFDENIFHAVHAIAPSNRGEYEITDALQWLIDRGHAVTYSVTNKKYSDVGTVERWLEANRWMLDAAASGGQADRYDTSEGCTIIPPISIGKGCQLKNSVIGPYVSIAANAKIEQCVIENSIVLENVELQNIPHPIKNSVFGANSTLRHLNAETRTANVSVNECVSEYVLGNKTSIITKTKRGEQ